MKGLSRPAGPRRDFLPRPPAWGAAGRGTTGWVGLQEAARSRLSRWGGFSGAAHFTSRPSGAPGWTRNGGMLHRETKAAATGSKVTTWERGRGCRAAPSPETQTQFRLQRGSGGCRAGGWDKMAAVKSSLKRPKLLMCMKPRQHPFCTPEGTKAQASPVSHSAGATCRSLNIARYVAGMKVAFPARVLRERLPKSKDCQVKRVKPPRTVVSDWLYIISIASSTGIII